MREAKSKSDVPSNDEELILTPIKEAPFSLFWFCLISIVLSLSSQIVFHPREFRFVEILIYILSLTLWLAILVLYALKILNRKNALAILLLEGTRNAFFDFLGQGLLILPVDEYQYHQFFVYMTIFACMMFGTVLGLFVHRFFALVYMVFAQFGYFVFMLRFPGQSPTLEGNFLVLSFIICGTATLVFFYRGLLDTIMSRLHRGYKESRKLLDKAELRNEFNHPFMVLGKNAAGLVHDLRNDVGLLSMQLQNIKLSAIASKPIPTESLVSAKHTLQRLEHRMRMVRFNLVDQEKQLSPEWIDVSSLIEAVIYPFKISAELRNKIVFSYSTPFSYRIWGQRFDILRIFENLIRNSCEALIDQNMIRDKGVLGTVELVVREDGDLLKIEVRDDGPGISFARFCDDPGKNCLSCDCFSIGKTTKAYGTGFGMVNIQRLMQGLNGTLRIRSSPGAGSCIILGFPRWERSA